MKKSIQNHLLAFLVSACLPVGLSAQLYVDPSNNVGVGTTVPESRFESYLGNTDGINATFTTESSTSTMIIGINNQVGNQGTGVKYGIRNSVDASSSAASSLYGLYNYITGPTSSAYGVYNNMSHPTTGGSMYGVRNQMTSGSINPVYGEYTNINATSNALGQRFGNYITIGGSGIGTRYGIYSSVTGPLHFAGYFNGNVAITGIQSFVSDSRTKQNVRPIESALGVLHQLQPSSYEYRQDMGLALPEGEQFGFIAQDLAKVLPNLVQETEAPLTVDAEEAAANAKQGKNETPVEPSDPMFMKVQAVNYIGLIPILTRAIQELEAKVDAQGQTITALQAEINRR